LITECASEAIGKSERQGIDESPVYGFVMLCQILTSPSPIDCESDRCY